ncbi:MAG: hypothetical protein ACOX9A_15470 [Anaerolineae bacterium]|jgi:hypothetical protein
MAGRWHRPTVDTKFHIDMDWWENNHRDIRVYMQDMLCEECKNEFTDDYRTTQEVDWVDDLTGEVIRVDGLWHVLRTCCSTKPDFITPSTPIVEAVFRTFLANGNKPLTVKELYERLDRRPPEVLLRMLTAGDVYMGIRPVR